MKSVSKHELVRLLSICGQVAEHKSEKMQEHGKEESEIVAVLSADEQAQLKFLLQKLQAHWLQEHAAHHKK